MPVRFSSANSSITVASSSYSGSIGTVYLAPSGKEGLALIVAGTDVDAQQSALLAFPYRTGVEVSLIFFARFLFFLFFVSVLF